MHDIYDSEALTADIADAIDATMRAEVGETFSRGYDSHAFNVETPSGLKFVVTVTQVEPRGPSDFDFEFMSRTGETPASYEAKHMYDPPAIPGTFIRPGYPGDINDPERFPGH